MYVNAIPAPSVAILAILIAYAFAFSTAANIQHVRKLLESQEARNEEAAKKFRSDFLQVLLSRRILPAGPPSAELANPVREQIFQESLRPSFSEAKESFTNEAGENITVKIRQEKVYLITEEGDQGRLPVLILSMMEGKQQKRPAVVHLHGTGKSKKSVRPILKQYASKGYIAISIDNRYHGERAENKSSYQDALVQAWRIGDAMPFVFDTVWDLIKLADYLTQREDIDHSRIGITGKSLGGIEAWFAAAADTRYAVAVPIIGVQGFRWAIDNDKWQGRVDTMKPVFEVAASDLGKRNIDKEVVEKVWDRIAPGLDSKFDSPYSVPPIAPRPLLILNGAADPHCPLGGLDTPVSKARDAYQAANCSEKFKFIAQPDIGHELTSLMLKDAFDWFDKFLK